jgi:hypothetical protein
MHTDTLSIRQQVFNLFFSPHVGAFDFESKLDGILYYFNHQRQYTKLYFPSILDEDFKLFFRFILFSREKNQRNFVFTVIYKLYVYFPEWTFYAIQLCIYKYGSWRDFREICSLVKNRSQNTSHPIILFCVDLVNRDLVGKSLHRFSFQTCATPESFIPREKSADSWLWRLCVNHWIHNFCPNSKTKCTTECFKEYRRFLSSISCNSKHLYSLNTYNNVRYISSIYEFVERVIKPFCIPSAERLTPVSFKDAPLVVSSTFDINSCWEEYISTFQSFGRMVPIIDANFKTVAEMYLAIGMACLVCEKTTFGRRVLIIHPTKTLAWVNLKNVYNFSAMVQMIYLAIHSALPFAPNHCSSNQSLYDAFKFIIQPFHYLPSHFFKEYNFVFFSNFRNGYNHQDILSLFSQNSLDFGNILYWNMSSCHYSNYPVNYDDNKAIYIFDTTGRSLFLLNHIHNYFGTPNTCSFFSDILQTKYSL